jgi:hypothetical protein
MAICKIYCGKSTPEGLYNFDSPQALIARFVILELISGYADISLPQ